MAAAESVAAKRSSYGVLFNDTDSFQFDNFAQTLGADLPPSPRIDSSGLTHSKNGSAMSPSLGQSPSKPGKSRNGFFRRMLVGDSQSKRSTDAPEAVTEVESSPQSLRHRASNLFKKSNTSEKATSLNISSPVPSQARSPGKANAIGQRMYRESVIASSATSLQEFLDLDQPSHKKESTPEKALNPIISPSLTRNQPSQVIDAFIAKNSDRPAEYKSTSSFIPLSITEHATKTEHLTDVQPSLARDNGLAITRLDSPKRPRIRTRNSEPNEKGEQSTDNDLSAVQAIKAKSLFERTDVSMHPEDYAAYLGKDDPFNAAVRVAFMGLFDFAGMSIVNALRQMCAQLYIRGETQVIDRLIEAFAKRWRACNTDEKYLTQDVTYIIAFALITLNTDLHNAGLESDQKMKKSQFVQNTMQAIQSGQSGMTSKRIDPNSSNLGDNQSIRMVQRSPSTNSFRDAYAAKENDTRVSTTNGVARSGSVRRSHLENHARATQIMMESRDAYLRTILEDLFVSVKNSQIQQPSFANQVLKTELNRTSSVASRASSSGRGGLFRRDATETSGRTPTQDFSNNNSIVSFDQVNDAAVSERSVSAYGRSVSMYTSQQSSRASIGSRASSTSRFSMRAPASTRAIGFVRSLANAMIREEATSPTTSDFQDVLDIQDKQDEELTLSGAPFAKEGRVRHKFQPKIVPRRGKQKGWSAELFAVLEKGQLRLFDFSAKSVKSNGQGVGGGDWTENARSVATLDLIQAIASAIPKEAQTKQRPYVWQLLLTNGDIHMFEVGTEHLIHEWTSTANYWAARVTKAPLRGAVDSAEYGWGQILDIAIDNENLEEGTRDQSAQRRPSQFSMGASDRKFDFIAAQFPGNKVLISDWQPDLIFSLPSQCTPDEQLTLLSKHLEDLRGDLGVHNKRREFIPRAFSPKHANLAKAMSNFERRSKYLQSEMVKYSSYVTALEVGIIRAKAVAGEFAVKEKERQGSVASEYSEAGI